MRPACGSEVCLDGGVDGRGQCSQPRRTTLVKDSPGQPGAAIHVAVSAHQGFQRVNILRSR